MKIPTIEFPSAWLEHLAQTFAVFQATLLLRLEPTQLPLPDGLEGFVYLVVAWSEFEGKRCEDVSDFISSFSMLVTHAELEIRPELGLDRALLVDWWELGEMPTMIPEILAAVERLKQRRPDLVCTPTENAAAADEAKTATRKRYLRRSCQEDYRQRKARATFNRCRVGTGNEQPLSWRTGARRPSLHDCRLAI